MKRTQTNDLLIAMRNGWSPDHNELIDFFNGVSSAIKGAATGLSDKCTASVIDYCDESVGAIENDQIEQREEQAWRDKKPSYWPEPDFSFMNIRGVTE